MAQGEQQVEGAMAQGEQQVERVREAFVHRLRSIFGVCDDTFARASFLRDQLRRLQQQCSSIYRAASEKLTPTIQPLLDVCLTSIKAGPDGPPRIAFTVPLVSL
jgi:uncharacterized membrane protein YccC